MGLQAARHTAGPPRGLALSRRGQVLVSVAAAKCGNFCLYLFVFAFIWNQAATRVFMFLVDGCGASCTCTGEI